MAPFSNLGVASLVVTALSAASLGVLGTARTACAQEVAVQQFPRPPTNPPPHPPDGLPVITDWPEGEPPLPRYHRGKQPRRGPIIAGSVVLGVFWGLSVLIAGGEDVDRNSCNDACYGPRPNLNALLVPVGGPFIELGQSESSAATVLLLIDGFSQSAGLGLIIWGFASPSQVLVPNQVASFRVVPVPTLLGRGAQGAGLVGSF